jgi:parallel beta-helix repeat protein
MVKNDWAFKSRSIRVYFLLICCFIVFLSSTPQTLANLHGLILIDGNSQFTPGNGVVSGSGSATNPYIIENWEIDVSGDDGIKITNTDAHFVIRNCTISGVGVGILLQYVTNGEIEGNTCFNSTIGIGFYQSSNNTLNGSTAYNNTLYGMYLYDNCNNNTLTNNTCFNNMHGILLSSSYYNILTNNTCYDNERGIYILDSPNNVFTDNTCANNSLYGIYIHNSRNTTIANCKIYNNPFCGMYNVDSAPAYVVNATYCWWGASTGPGGVAHGTGDNISANSAFVSMGVVALANGTYSYQTLLNDPGTYNFNAYWAGNENYNASTSSTITVTATAALSIDPLWYVAIAIVVIVAIAAAVYFMRRK